MKKFCVMFLSVIAVVSLVFAGRFFLAVAEENNLEIHDKLIDCSNSPAGVEYVNFGYNQDFSDAAYFGEDGDEHGFKLNGANIAYAEYTVSNASSIEALYYFHKDWSTVSYVKTDETALTQNQYVAWGMPEGNDYIPRFISKSTGLIYVQMNGNWWAYTDTATVAGGDYSYFNTETTNFNAPDENDLIPYGAGFAYTVDGETWQWAERELDVASLATNVNYKREVWRAKNLPPMIKKVRVYLIDREVYVKSDTSTGTVVAKTPTNCIGWYLGIADIKIGYYKNIEGNTPPVVNGTHIECLQGRAVQFELTVSDDDGDAVNLLFDKTNLKGDIVKISGNRYKYVAPKNEYGEYSFTYRGYDNYAYSEPATVTVIVIEHDGKYVEADLKMVYPETDVITLNCIFANGMVLQQKQNNKIWGVTLPDNTVTYQLKDKNGVTVDSGMVTANEEGYYSFILSSRNASFDKYVMTVSDDSGSISVSDILFGEVWLSSGQSNMELQAQYCIDTLELLENADNEYIRFFLEPTVPAASVASDFSYTPVYESGGVWGFGNNSEDAKVVSAVSYAFALKLFAELNVPVAIINTSLGATSIETWVSRKGIEDNADFTNQMKSRGLFLDSAYWNTKNEWNFNQMTAMFNHKIASIAGYGIKGVIWYQGENDVGDMIAADNYKKNLKTLIDDWSYWWGCENLPLCYVELESVEYNYLAESLSYFREKQVELWSENKERMGYCTIYDVNPEYRGTSFGYISPCHPLYKETVGTRLAETALFSVYHHESYEDCIPATVSDFRISGSKIILTYDNVGGKLKVKEGDNDLKGFCVCGENRIFVPATATIISDNEVEVFSPYVKVPVAVTYAFSGMNIKSNLYNGKNFPVAPYRSDTVASIYYQPKDWMDADSLTEWICYGFNANDSGYENVWVSNPISDLRSTISLEQNDKVFGSASLRITYDGEGGAVGAVSRPQRKQFDFDPVFGHIDNYSVISLWLKNNDTRDKTLSVTVKDTKGNIYLLCVDGKRATSVAIPASSEWKEYVFSLKNMVCKGGTEPEVNEDVISNLASMEFTVTDSGAGSVLIDKLQLHLSAERTEYTVKFITGTKQTIADQTIVEGETADEPRPLERIGYIFRGWKLNGDPYDFSSPVNSDITLVAEWELKKVDYTVRFITNTDYVIADQTVTEGNKAAKPSTPSKEGYEFSGWYLNGSLYDFDTVVNSDITLMAEWREITVPAKKKGCKSSLGATGSLLFVIAAAVFIVKEKKHG